MPRFEAVIFDLDGVLVDTAELHYRGWKRLADELGIPFDRKKNERLKGVPRMEALRILLEDFPGRQANLNELADRKNGYYVEMIKQITPGDLLPGVEPLLKALRAKKIKIGVASSSKNAKPVIAKLGITASLDVITDGHDDQEPKPAPDLFLECARRLGVPPAQCVVLEDAQVGVDAARAAGMCAIGVGRAENLKGADRLVARTADFPMELL